jgi:M6 family metalloprotease-like protein
MAVTLSDIKKTFYNLKQSGTVKKPKTVTVVVIAWEPIDVTAFLTNKIGLENLIFGSNNSVADYIKEMSGGRFLIKPATNSVVIVKSVYQNLFYNRTLSPNPGIYAPPTNPSNPHYYRDSNNANWYLDDEGFIDGYIHSWSEAIISAVNQGLLDFSILDKDKDGVFSNEDGVVVIVKPMGSNETGSSPHSVYRSQVPLDSLVVNGVTVEQVCEVYANSQPYSDNTLAIIAEEIIHFLLAYVDEYPDVGAKISYRSGSDPRRPGQFSLSDSENNWNSHPANEHLPVHINPYFKLKWGWLSPKLVTKSGRYKIKQTSLTGEALIIISDRGAKEFFILENRCRSNSYDDKRDIGSGDGLAIWNCIQDENKNQDFGRRCLFLRRAHPEVLLLGEPDDRFALFDPDNSLTSYVVDDNSYPQTMRYDDGVGSRIRVIPVLRVADTITVHIQLPHSVEDVLSWLQLLLQTRRVNDLNWLLPLLKTSHHNIEDFILIPLNGKNKSESSWISLL